MPLTNWDKLRVAIFQGKTNDVRDLLPFVNIKEKGNDGITLLHAAVYHKAHEAIVKLLIAEFREKRVSIDTVNNQGITPLDCAFLRGNIIAIELLIAAGADFRRKRFNTADETYLDGFYKKYSEESGRIRDFIDRYEKEAQPTSELIRRVEPEVVISREPSETIIREEGTQKTSAFGFVNVLFNQFKGYTKIPTTDKINASKTQSGTPRRHPSKHLKDD